MLQEYTYNIDEIINFIEIGNKHIKERACQIEKLINHIMFVDYANSSKVEHTICFDSSRPRPLQLDAC